MQITIIGAGPRGLALTERLSNLTPAEHNLQINLVDPSPIGGRVWNPFLENNQLFLMNTVASQVTLFHDQYPGKTATLLEWAQGPADQFLRDHPEFPSAYRSQLADLNDESAYSTRGLMGVYAAWYFQELQDQLSANHQIHYYNQVATRLKVETDGYRIILGDGQELISSKVAMALGHSEDRLSPNEKQLATYADQHHLGYWPAQHPAESNFNQLNHPQTVIARGFGLSFYDYLAALSLGKGGHFTRRPDGFLTYQPSGQEPHIIVGSRTGFPPRTRGFNQKGPSELYQPVFFTWASLDQLRSEHDGKLPYEDFEKLLYKEMDYVYLVNAGRLADFNPEKQAALEKDLETSADFEATARQYGMSLADLDLRNLRHPDRQQGPNQSFEDFFKNYLKDDIESAKLGNADSPLTGSFEILRDLRGMVRTIFEQDYFNDHDRQRFVHEFRSLEGRLSVGPPLIRTEQLLALIEAGLVTVLEPGIQIETGDDHFWASDRGDHHYQADGVIEARLATVDFHIALNPLLKDLQEQGLIQASPIDERAIDINRVTFKLNQHGLYLSGIPTEGYKYFTTVIPRPGVNTPIFKEATAIASSMLK
ncbi:FAD/NAD(P)-binding protein [Leuconostocaceae bacterium ESL0723]|nr:FAD/NAD(P)-binding protein [Leuconostocaceae bacterium ESL0723]